MKIQEKTPADLTQKTYRWFQKHVHNDSTKMILAKWSRRLVYFTVSLSILIILLILIPDFLIVYGKSILHFDAETGPIGDSIGGTLGPFVGAIAAVLTFFAFWVQYQANQQQKTDLARERFENNFFEMLKLHKENINEMVIEGYDVVITSTNSYHQSGGATTQETKQKVEKDISGRKVFVTNYYELKACYDVCEYALASYNFEGKDRYLIEISYKLFFFGSGNNQIVSVNKNIEHDRRYVSECKSALREARKIHIRTSAETNFYQLPRSNKRIKIPIKYKPFAGHANRLGHYYRHLYMMMKFVSSQADNLISRSEKQEYFRIVRAQLSTFEQLMLYFNYLSGLGSNWENERNYFFSEYCMIKNIPIALTEFTISPSKEFGKLIEYCQKSDKKMFKEFSD